MAQQYNIALFGETNSIQDFRSNMFAQKGGSKMSLNKKPDIYTINSVEFAIYHNGYPEGVEIHATIAVANDETNAVSQILVAEYMVKNSKLSHLPTVSFGLHKNNSGYGNIKYYRQSKINKLFTDLIYTLTKNAIIEDNVAPENSVITPETREIMPENTAIMPENTAIMPENTAITTYEARGDLVIATTVSVKVYKLTI
jgi:hypothetical protein